MTKLGIRKNGAAIARKRSIMKRLLMILKNKASNTTQETMNSWVYLEGVSTITVQ